MGRGDSLEVNKYECTIYTRSGNKNYELTDDTYEMLPYEVQGLQDVIGPLVDLLNLSSQL